jgi:5-(carboxyamino)imidazole ribonucleotide mutase
VTTPDPADATTGDTPASGDTATSNTATSDNTTTSAPTTPRVAVVMGSDSDWPVMEDAVEALEQFGIGVEVHVLSAHRTPDAMIAYGRAAAGKGIRVIIAGAGGAAHLPGMIASVTTLPVIGVPVPLKTLDGLDSLLSIVQMPAGIPVATVSIGGGRNAGILAARIIGAHDARVAEALAALARDLEGQVAAKNEALQSTVANRTHSTSAPTTPAP